MTINQNIKISQPSKNKTKGNEKQKRKNKIENLISTPNPKTKESLFPQIKIARSKQTQKLVYKKV